MTFPLSKVELDDFKKIKKKMARVEFVTITGREYEQWQDFLKVMAERELLQKVQIDGEHTYRLTGDFAIFEKWLFQEHQKAKKLSIREWKIAIISGCIVALFSEIIQLILKLI